jgi:hypothetical protein
MLKVCERLDIWKLDWSRRDLKWAGAGEICSGSGQTREFYRKMGRGDRTQKRRQITSRSAVRHSTRLAATAFMSLGEAKKTAYSTGMQQVRLMHILCRPSHLLHLAVILHLPTCPWLPAYTIFLSPKLAQTKNLFSLAKKIFLLSHIAIFYRVWIVPIALVDFSWLTSSLSLGISSLFVV